MLADAKAGKWVNVAQAVVPLPIERLLDALEQLRDADLLRSFTHNLDQMPIVRSARLDAALLAITTFSTDYRLRALNTLQVLTDDEFKSIQARKAAWSTAGTSVNVRPVMRWDYTTYGPWKGAKDTPTMCTEGTFDASFASMGPADWLKGFLEFYDFMPPPMHDPANRSVLFNHQHATVDQVIDLAYEQYLYSMQVYWTPTFKNDGEPGVEYQGFVQVQFGKYADDPDRNFRLQQVMAGGQVAWVIPLFEKAAQVSFFAQALTGYAGLNSPSAGIGAQAAAGAQFAVNVPGTKGIVQLVGAVQGGATGSFPIFGRPSFTGDIGGQGGVVVKVLSW
jgi:hypothetical protein